MKIKTISVNSIGVVRNIMDTSDLIKVFKSAELLEPGKALRISENKKTRKKLMKRLYMYARNNKLPFAVTGVKGDPNIYIQKAARLNLSTEIK